MGQAVDAADRKIGALQCLEQDLQIIRVKAVVRIQKGEILPLSGIYAGISRGRCACILLPQHADAAVAGGPGAAKVGAGVGTAVIHHNGLPVRVSLRLQALQAGVQISRGIVDRDDDRDQRRHARIPADTGSTAKRFSWKGSFGAIRSSVHAGHGRHHLARAGTLCGRSCTRL